MKLYLGTHESQWLDRTSIPLFISSRRLAWRKRFPRANVSWALDSGGFSELSLYGEWRTTAKEYVRLSRLYMQEIGNMEWAAIQDWMCEPFMLAKTGKMIVEHQMLTIQSFLDLKSAAPEVNYIPVLQGWNLPDYERHIEMYAKRNIDLRDFDVVGLGSVCRRQATDEVAHIIHRITATGIRLHGFGLKQQGLRKTNDCLTSADSMAWSYHARLNAPLPQCTHPKCSNCLAFAEKWYSEIGKEFEPSV